MTISVCVRDHRGAARRQWVLVLARVARHVVLLFFFSRLSRRLETDLPPAAKRGARIQLYKSCSLLSLLITIIVVKALHPASILWSPNGDFAINYLWLCSHLPSLWWLAVCRWEEFTCLLASLWSSLALGFLFRRSTGTIKRACKPITRRHSTFVFVLLSVVSMELLVMVLVVDDCLTAQNSRNTIDNLRWWFQCSLVVY